MTAPCAIEYILVTRWRGGKKGGQNRVCACDTRDRGVNKKLKPDSLHSHPVGCATTDPNTHHLALCVPTGAGQPYTGPSEWAPVMVHIAASLLWPDLPFLVTSPDYILGAQATLSELRRCLGYPSAFSLFTTSHSLAGSDVLLHLPPPSTFSLTPVSTPPIPFADPLPPPHDFRYTSPDDALQLIATLTVSQMAAQHTKFGRVASNAMDADLYYPFFFFALCCLGKIPGGAPFSQLHKSGNGSRVDRP